MLPRLATLVGAETVVIPAINGLPWWYFYKEGGRFDGQSAACLDPAATLFEALAPRHMLGAVVPPAAEVPNPAGCPHHAPRVVLFGDRAHRRSARAQLLLPP